MSDERRGWSRIRGWSTGLSWSFGANGLIAVCGFVNGVILARMLGPEIRGEVAMIILWSAIGSMFGDMGLSQALAFEAGKRPDLLNRLWGTALLAGSVVGAVIAAAAVVLLPHVLHLRNIAWPDLTLVMAAVPLTIVTTHQASLLLGQGRIKENAIVRFMGAGSYTVGLGSLAAIGSQSARSYLIAFAVSQSISAAGSWLILASRVEHPPKLDRGLIPSLLSFGMRSQLGTVSAQATLRMDQLLMSLILPARDLGLYVVAVSVSSATGPLFGALATATLPRVISAPDEGTAAWISAQHVKLGMLLAVPTVSLGVVFAPWLVPAIFGRQFAGAIVSSQVLLVASMPQGLNAILGATLRGIGRPGLSAAAEASGLAATVILLVLLLPRLGIDGAALTSLMAYLTVFLTEAFLLWKHTHR